MVGAVTLVLPVRTLDRILLPLVGSAPTRESSEWVMLVSNQWPLPREGARTDRENPSPGC